MPDNDGLTRAVLIADDDSLVRMVLRMAVENLGHDVVDVASSDELMALADHTFALCIMDASMPGATLEHRLSLLETRAPGMPIIVMSGFSDQPDAVQQRGLPFMAKPISLDDLTTALNAVVPNARSEMDPA